MDKQFYVVISADSNYLSKERFGDGSKIEFFSYDSNCNRYTVWNADIVKRIDKRTKETKYMRICYYIDRFAEVK